VGCARVGWDGGTGRECGTEKTGVEGGDNVLGLEAPGESLDLIGEKESVDGLDDHILGAVGVLDGHVQEGNGADTGDDNLVEPRRESGASVKGDVLLVDSVAGGGGPGEHSTGIQLGFSRGGSGRGPKTTEGNVVGPTSDLKHEGERRSGGGDATENHSDLIGRQDGRIGTEQLDPRTLARGRTDLGLKEGDLLVKRRITVEINMIGSGTHFFIINNKLIIKNILFL
jgi:hypothetical protein